MAKEDRSLTPKQARFVEEYLKDLNATQAAIRAGYSERTANEQGARLLANVSVAAVVAKRKAELTEDAGITQERVLQELSALAFSSVTHYRMNAETGALEAAPGAPPNAMAAVSSVEYESYTDALGGVTRKVKFKLWDKPGQVKLAGRYKAVKGFFDKVEVSGPNGGPIEVAAPVKTSAELRQELAALTASLEADGKR